MIVVILLVSALTRIWYTMQPMLLWWDAAMYIGMGKYIFSHGTIGIFEIFRPLGMSLVLGFLWKIGLDPLFWGKILSVLSSLTAIYMVYLIGEKIQKHTGLYASTLLSFSAVFFAYTSAPLSDIPSVMFALIALYAYLNGKYYWSGFLTSLAFLTRFPLALMVVALVVSALYLKEYSYTERLKKGLWIGVGFATLALPYFVVNFILYGNPFLPILLGSEVAAIAAKFYAPHTYFFYIKGLLIQNPFLIFSLLVCIPFIISSYKKFRSSLLPIVISTIIMGGYFSANSHQELRYGISFLPFLCIGAGFGITVILEKFSWNYRHYAGILLVTLSLLYICNEAYDRYSFRFKSTPQVEAFHGFFHDKTNARVITTSPQMTAYSDIHLVDAFDTWEKAAKVYTEQRDETEYFALNDCVMICDDEATCQTSKDEFLSSINQEEKVFDEKSQYCSFTIYKIKK